ncbi:MAG TPA: MOSC domain-containing protein [Thermomicrobiaceae bacterium]|nr:MOSC domain-containing protein [Thermomicrobiaceae bacterium]
MAGRVEGIFITSGAGRPMEPVTEARALAGSGLAGDRYQAGNGYYSQRPLPGGGRELTLIEVEVLEALARETGIVLAPAETRRNLTTRGLRLNALVGARFTVGDVLCEGVRLCEPCVHLEELTGKAVNAPLVHRGGLRAGILSGGVIHVGDAVAPVDGDATVSRTALGT